MKRTAQFVQNTLILVFMTGFVLNVAAAALTYARGAIYADMLKVFVLRILAIYSMPMAAILGGVFGQRGVGKASAPAQASRVALTAAVLWNLLLIIRVMIFAGAKNDDFSELMAYLGDVSAASAFLIAGTLAFYFTKRETR